MPHIPAFVPHAPVGKRLRYSDSARALQTQRRKDNNDLYAWPESRRKGHAEPGFNCAVMTAVEKELEPEIFEALQSPHKRMCGTALKVFGWLLERVI